MSLPAVLDVKPIKFPQEVEDGTLSIASYVEVKIPFNLQIQEQGNWCWAATSVSINRFYDPGTMWTQCKLASHEFSGNDCCANGGSPACNHVNQVPRPLRDLGNFGSTIRSPAGFQTIMDEINGTRPFICAIIWRGGGGHAVVVYGFAQADYDGLFDQWVFVNDPLAGVRESKYLYNKFKTDYQGAGDWTETYLTKA